MSAALEHLPKKRLKWDFNSPVSLLVYQNVHTVCEESRCPNRHECSAAGVATFLIGGRVCTRSCKFCHIATGRGPALSQIAEKEKQDILSYVERARLKFVVITAVARDDDELGLARHFADITRALKQMNVETELLIPDFHGRSDCLDIVAEASPLVIAHNVETVRRLAKSVRPQASHDRTLQLYQYIHQKWPDVILKAGFMVGLGESIREIEELLRELKASHVEVVTIGQYMQPSSRQNEVQKIYSSHEFDLIENMVQTMGFNGWEVGPFVRSSYMAGRTMEQVIVARKKGQHGSTA